MPRRPMTPRWPRSDSAPIPITGLESRPVTEIMSDQPLTIAPSVEASRAIELASERGVEHLVVVRAGGELLGVLCTCDLWDAVSAPVAGVMSTPPVTISSRATVDDAASLMRGTGVGCLPVVDDDGKAVGVVTRGDLARAGILDLTDQTCASCGSHHHVRRLTGYESAFCTSCLDRTPPAVTYDELGWGD